MTTLEEVLSSIQYKPHYAFSCQIEAGGLRIVMDMWLAHQNPPGVTIRDVTTISFDMLLSAGWERLDREQSIRILYKWIRECEEHEMKEWFRVDGVKVYDPHVSESPHEYAGKQNPFTQRNLLEDWR